MTVRMTVRRTRRRTISIIPPPEPTALLPRLDSISGGVDKSFSADDEQRPGASAQGGTRSAAADDEQGRKSGHQGGSCPGGGKPKEGSVAGTGQKKCRALTQPFKTPQKSQDNDNNDDDNGFTFQNMMSMMMYQSALSPLINLGTQHDGRSARTWMKRV